METENTVSGGDKAFCILTKGRWLNELLVICGQTEEKSAGVLLLGVTLDSADSFMVKCLQATGRFFIVSKAKRLFRGLTASRARLCQSLNNIGSLEATCLLCLS